MGLLHEWFTSFESCGCASLQWGMKINGYIVFTGYILRVTEEFDKLITV